MLTLWLAVVALSISPALHQLLHHDSQSGKHECLVTHFIKSQVFSGASASVVLVVDPVRVAAPLPVALAFVSSPEYSLSSSRAPPALFSSLKG
jgi:hypothetical protein